MSILFMLLVNVKWYIFSNTIKGQSLDFITSMFSWDPSLITGLRLMSIWVLAYHLYHYNRQQLVLARHNAELSILAKQIQIDHLSNQLNPHFLFNSLNSVKSLISENPAKAKRSIDLLSDILRSSIYTKENLTTVENELQLIKDYIELEKLRFEDRLQVNITVDQDVRRCKIPTLSIQTLIENALKHGIRNSVKGGTISLEITDKLENIEILVQNSGELISKTDQDDASFGLKNLRERLFLEYKDKAIFSINENPNGIISATIVMPKTN